jgi:hypothetical protein
VPGQAEVQVQGGARRSERLPEARQINHKPHPLLNDLTIIIVKYMTILAHMQKNSKDFLQSNRYKEKRKEVFS